MKQAKKKKLIESLQDLERAIANYSPSSKERSLSFLAASKAFEVAIEYGWKYYKSLVEDAGMEAYSPKDTIREAAQLGLISNPKLWIDTINARNLSVHDYFTVSEDDFILLAKDFLKMAYKDIKKD